MVDLCCRPWNGSVVTLVPVLEPLMKDAPFRKSRLKDVAAGPTTVKACNTVPGWIVTFKSLLPLVTVTIGADELLERSGMFRGAVVNAVRY